MPARNQIACEPAEQRILGQHLHDPAVAWQLAEAVSISLGGVAGIYHKPRWYAGAMGVLPAPRMGDPAGPIVTPRGTRNESTYGVGIAYAFRQPRRNRFLPEWVTRTPVAEPLFQTSYL